MKYSLKEIKLGYGLGNLKFGMERTQVKLLLGTPSFIDKYSHSEDPNDLTESWEYDDLGLSLSFDKEEDWKLIMLSVTSNFYELEGIKIIGNSELKVMDTLKSLNFEDLTLEDCSEFDGENHNLIEIEDKSVNFWFKEGVLDEIQWTPFFIDDDTIQWPK
jgi:hypothetical protein